MDLRISIRLQCMDMAVRTVGNPNHTQQAEEYFNWIMKVDPPPMADPVSEVAEPTTSKKGKTK